MDERFSVKHTDAQRVALAILRRHGWTWGALAEVSGAAERTVQHWYARHEAGTLRSTTDKIREALEAYQVASPAALSLPSFTFAQDANEPAQVVDLGGAADLLHHAGRALPPAPSAPPLAPVQAQDGAPQGSLSSKPSKPRRAGKVQGSLFGAAPSPTPASSSAPSSPLPPSLGLGEDESAELPVEVPAHVQHIDGQEVLQSYSALVIWRLMQIGEVMASSRRLPAWQLQQLRGATDVFKHLSSMTTPRIKPVAYEAPRAAAHAKRGQGEVLFALGELVERAENPKDLEAIEHLVRRVRSGEISLDAGGEDDDGGAVQ